MKNYLINLDGYQINTLANAFQKITIKNPNRYALHCLLIKDKETLKKKFHFLKNIYCFEEFALENYDNIKLCEYKLIENDLKLKFQIFNNGFEAYSRYYIHPILSSKKKFEISKKRIILNYRFYKKIFNEFNPNVIIHEHSGGRGSKILWHMCKKFKCDYFFFLALYHENKFLFLNHKDFSYPLFNPQKLKKYSNTELKIFKNSINTNTIAPFERQSRKSLQIDFYKKIQSFYNRAKIYYSNNNEINYLLNRFPPILDNIIFYLFTKLRKFLFKIIFQDKIDFNEKYVVIFLQVEPEVSTYSLNNNKISWVSLISILSKCLPNDFKIYIKEHPSQYVSSRFRPLSFFRKLKAINKVKICPLFFNSAEIVKKSQLVITGGGTVVYESILHNIPCVIFGKNFYYNFKSIFSIDKEDQIKTIIKKINLYKIRNTDENVNLNYALNIKNSLLDGYIFLSNKDKAKLNDKIIQNSLVKFFKLFK
jgi:hypothetical protein